MFTDNYSTNGIIIPNPVTITFTSHTVRRITPSPIDFCLTTQYFILIYNNRLVQTRITNHITICIEERIFCMYRIIPVKLRTIFHLEHIHIVHRWLSCPISNLRNRLTIYIPFGITVATYQNFLIVTGKISIPEILTRISCIH